MKHGLFLQITNEDYRTRFVLSNATRKHAGKYTLTATNVNGTDQHSVEVMVLGRPSAPEGDFYGFDYHALISFKC